MRVLCIDPALRNTGYAVVEALPPLPQGQRRTISGPGEAGIRTLAYGVIRNHAKILQSGCLVAIRSALQEIIREFGPTTCAMESVIFVQNNRTAIVLGAARGAAMMAAAEAGLDVYEYPPRRVKQAVVGRGAADKQQVAFMVRALLGLKETPLPDAADALAIGITHIQAVRSPVKSSLGNGRKI
ncbi:MAG: crossover junction endodeoxyribonuclease RuvC [Verrucomicrobiales bacterium]|nr:crossover junction endodeoxyribonuclease RuvC [Verrucomicrobiales bacterium]